jgi:hypothetical protein
MVVGTEEDVATASRSSGIAREARR